DPLPKDVEMKVAILHVGDAHIVGANEEVLTRAKRIVDAARLVESAPDLCIVALTGDLAFSGRPAQFALARTLVDEMLRHLRDAWGGEGAEIRVVAIPGNHDCDFSAPSLVRDELIAAIEKD